MTTQQTDDGHSMVDLSKVPAVVIDEFALDRLPLERPRRTTDKLLRLDGKVAVVTGGGGDGLGNATCHRLAEQGAVVAIIDVNQSAGAQAARDVAATWGGTAEAFVGNVADWDEAHGVTDAIVEHFGGIDVLVNNAGGSGAVGRSGSRLNSSGAFADSDRNDLETIVDVNFRGVLHMTKAVLRSMLARGNGRIINVASEGGKQGMSGLVAYNSAKSAVIGFTRNLAHEVGPQGVTIAAVCPGIMVTERLLATGNFRRVGALGEGWRRTTIGRCSLPDEVASMIAFLASDAGSYVHGTAVSVGGGMADD